MGFEERVRKNINSKVWNLKTMVKECSVLDDPLMCRNYSPWDFVLTPSHFIHQEDKMVLYSRTDSVRAKNRNHFRQQREVLGFDEVQMGKTFKEKADRDLKCD